MTSREPSVRAAAALPTPVHQPVRPAEEGPVDFDLMVAAFRRAAEQNPAEVVARHYRLGGGRVVIRCAGTALSDDIHAPMAHLQLDEAPEVAPDLEIEIWDERATGVGCQACVIGPDPEATGTVSIYGPGRFVLHQSPQARSVIDRRARRIVTWIADHERLTQYELGRPLHSDLLLWHRDRGIQAVHAGLVALGGEGVLFGGPGGSGKTTTALTCLRAGMAYLADDYVGLQLVADSTWLGHSLYSSTHLAPHHIKRFPDLIPHSRPGRMAREDKHLVLLERLYPGRFAASATIRVIALPRVVDATETRTRPASKIEVLRQLAPSSLFGLPYGSSGRKSFDAMVGLVESVPTVWLELGRDLEGIPRAVAALIGRKLPES